MQKIVDQLESVRGRAKRLLFGEAIARWLAALIVAAAVCMIIDYLLRLPGWFRLIVDLAVLGVALRWLAMRLRYGMRFNPSLADLAQRAEKMFPATRGWLASAVEFQTLGAGPGESPQLTKAAVREAEQRTGALRLRSLINTTPATRAATMLFVVVLATAAAAWASPAHLALAGQRWLAPLGDAQWPKRTAVQSMVAVDIWPTDQPMRLVAWVDRGYHAGMRTWADYRIIQADGSATPWRSTLMNEQADAADPLALHSRGRFERLIDLPQELAELTSGDSAQAVEFLFRAGDDQTRPQRMNLIIRPALTGLTLDVQPPRYAAGLISPQSIQLQGQSGQVATATVRAGSQVTWQLTLNKPLPPQNLTIAKLMPALPDGIDAEVRAVEPTVIHVAMRALDSMQTTIHLIDQHELTDLSERQYRVQTVADQSPSAMIAEPSVDESVLAIAVVPVTGIGQDDVAIESVQLEAIIPAPSESESEQTTSQIELTAITGRAAQLTANHTLALEPLKLSPGDEVELTAIAQDVFDLDGQRHDPVRSTPRRLRIIDETQLAGQLRSELAAVRQSAIRLDDQQRQIADAPAKEATDAQKRLSRRLESQAALLEGLSKRIERNRMPDGDIKELTNQAGDLVREAAQASSDAGDHLDRARRRADEAPKQIEASKKAQQAVNDKLVSLIDLLDQGQDALTLQLQLQQLTKMQEQLLADVRKTLPQTAGKTVDQLADAQQQELKDLSQRQGALSQRASALAQQMQSTAEALDQPQASEKDQAAAEALSEAAAIAQRQGLAHEMKQASESAEENQLADASAHQSRSMDTMQQMLDQLGKQDRKRRDILKRKLLEIAQAIEKLVERQESQLARLDDAVQLAGLDGPMAVLRRNTIDVAELAGASRKTQDVGAKLDEASTHQASAVAALRASLRDAANDAEMGSLAMLRDALALVKQMEEAADREQRRQQREELMKQYEQLALQQETLRDKTQPFGEMAKLTRRQRADLINLGHEEADLRVAAQEVAEEEQPLLFEHIHGRIDSDASEAVIALRSGSFALAVIDRQSSVAMMLRQLAAALEKAQQEDDAFDSPDGGSGGGGGGQGGEQPLIPPAAELKLFRGLQESIYNRTRSANETAVPDDAARRKVLQALSVEQRELATLGERLVEQMKKNQPGTPRVNTPAPQEVSP